MSYTWTDGEVITAEKLNNTGGGGIFDCVFSLGENVSCDKTAEEITQAYLSGQYINAVLDFSAAPPKRALGVDCDTDSYGTHVQAEFLVVIGSGTLVDIMIIWNPAYERWDFRHTDYALTPATSEPS